MAISFDLAVIPMKKRQERWPEIPYDVVIEILTRVPPKSLMRFKSVSKQWSSLICSQYFTKRFQRVSSSAPRLYMRLIFDDLKTILQSAPPSSDSDITFEADQDLTRPAMSGYSPSKLFHGLMCFNKWPSALIYNTTTRQLVVLPDIEESNMIDSDHKSKKIMYSIGHDPVDDQYKVVCIVGRLSDQVEEYTYLSEHWVLLLGGGGGEDGSSRWRKISCGCTPHLPLGQGVINTNGRMHYLALVGMKAFCVSFDINSGEISMRQVPEDVFWLQIYCIYLIEYNGKIAILDYCNLRDQGVMKLWVVEDEEKNMWSSKTLVLHPCQMHMVNSIRLRVQGTTPNGDVIFAPNREDTCTFTICLYDLHKNHMRKVDIKGATPNSHLTKCCDIIGMDDVDNLIYL